jgi:hypothetical protein
MKKIILTLAIIAAISFTSCSSTDDANDPISDCVTCAAYQIAGIDVPAVEVCEGENGNAFVQGVDTTVAYATYISTLQQLTTCE